MTADPHIVIAGAGAVGCYLGGLLTQAGRKVTLIVRPRVADELRAHGLTLTDLDGHVHRMSVDQLALAHDPAVLSQADLVLVTVKSHDTRDIATLIDRYTAMKVPVISLQNGLSNTPDLRRALPGRDVRAGLVPYNIVPMGQGCFHRAVSGETMIEAGVGEWSRALSAPELPCVETRDIENLQWGKFLLNLNNALNALSGLPLQQQLRDRAWRKLMADQWGEALRVLKAARIRPASLTPVSVELVPMILRLPTPLFVRVAAAMLKIDPAARTSMAYDLMMGRTTEIAALQGEVVRMGALHGVPTPINAMVAEVLHCAELAGEGLPNLTPRALRAELGRLSQAA